MLTTHYRACNLCEAICGLAIEVDDNHVVSIKGDKADPFSRGHICPKAVSLMDIQHDPQRLRQPLYRRGGKASPLEPISFAEAYTIAAKRIAQTIRDHGADAVGSYYGNPTVHHFGLFAYTGAMMSLVKSKNRYSASTADQMPQQLLNYWLYGHLFLQPIPDLDRTDYWLILGGNPLASNGSMMTVPDVAKRIEALKARGGQLVVIDPRRTETAAVATSHHAIRPGSDVWLLSALLHTLRAEGLVNTRALGKHLTDFELALEAASALTPAAAAAATGIPAEAIKQLARDLAQAPSAAVYGRMGVSVQPHAAACHWLIQLLNIATGNLDAPGGTLWTRQAFAGTVNSRPGSYGRFTSRVRGLPEVNGELPAICMAEEIETAGAGQIRAMVTIAGNPVLSTPSGARLEAALGTLAFMVSIDLFENETTRCADLIIPHATALESTHYDSVFNGFAVRDVARWNTATLTPPTELPEAWQVLNGLGAALAAELGQPARTLPAPEELVTRGLAGNPYQLTFADLAAATHGLDLGALKPQLPEVLQTADRRIHCAPAPLMAAIGAILASCEAHSATPSATGTLTLIGRRHVRDNNSWMGRYHRLTKGKPRHQLWVHPSDLAARSIADTMLVQVTSSAGTVQVQVHADASLMPGVVSLPHGYGRSGGDQPGHVSINDLTDSAAFDPISGNAVLNGTQVTVSGVADATLVG